MIRDNKLCFNYARPNHRAFISVIMLEVVVRCVITPQSVIRNQIKCLFATGEQGVVYPVVVVEVNGIKCRALLDTDAGSSYISGKLIELLKIKPVTRVLTNRYDDEYIEKED